MQGGSRRTSGRPVYLLYIYQCCCLAYTHTHTNVYHNTLLLKINIFLLLVLVLHDTFDGNYDVIASTVDSASATVRCYNTFTTRQLVCYTNAKRVNYISSKCVIRAHADVSYDT